MSWYFNKCARVLACGFAVQENCFWGRSALNFVKSKLEKPPAHNTHKMHCMREYNYCRIKYAQGQLMADAIFGKCVLAGYGLADERETKYG